jgi:nucleoporin p58/p45
MFGSKPATTGNMFGGNTTQPQGQQTSLFGQPQQQQQQQQQQGTSLFGQPQPQQSQQQSGGLFGQTQSQSQTQNQSQQGQQGQSSLFGSTSQQPQQQQNSFGQKSTGLTLNQSSSSTGMNKGTKFTDLPEQHQKSIEQLE